MKPTMRGIFCFRRDLRLHDNLGLNDLSKICEGGILPIFCLDPRQLDATKNQYHSNLCVRFLFQSLADLDAQIRDACTKSKKPVVGLTVMAGTPEECIPALVKSLDSSLVVVGWNEDVTPFSRERDRRIRDSLANDYEIKGSSKKDSASSSIIVDFVSNPDDLTVVPVRSLKTGTGNHYKVFTPFCRAARARGIKNPKPFPVESSQFIGIESNNKPKSVEFLDARTLLDEPRFKNIKNDPAISDLTGGRTEALKRISEEFLVSHVKHYEVDRDFPWQDKTTKLSAFLKFGCVSYREAHQAVMQRLPSSASVAKEALTREFFWATFYHYITFHFPHVLQGQRKVFEPNNKTYENNSDLAAGRYDYDSVWDTGALADARLQAWKQGRTGFPFIDAAMRQMNQTGWMHNRARMAVASFLTKDLRIDWREGEKYFAQKLVDYEPSANSGGWQWSSSTGADSQPWFRIFNPWNQSTKHDMNAVYAKKFIPELRNVRPDDVHKWNEKPIRDKYRSDPLASKYPAPIVDHAAERVKTLAVWKKATGGDEKEAAAGGAGGSKKKTAAAPKATATKASSAPKRRARSVSSDSSSDVSSTTVSTVTTSSLTSSSSLSSSTSSSSVRITKTSSGGPKKPANSANKSN